MRKRVRLAGRLAGFVTIPLDIFIQVTYYAELNCLDRSLTAEQIASCLNPQDLLQMLRTARIFLGVLTSKTSKPIWQSAFDNLPGVPKCPPDLSEIGYAALIFNKFCQVRLSTVLLCYRLISSPP